MKFFLSFFWNLDINIFYPNEPILPLNNNKSESEIQLQAKTERKNDINNKLSLTGRGSKINWKSSNGKNYKIIYI